jgi:hypothetical protein
MHLESGECVVSDVLGFALLRRIGQLRQSTISGECDSGEHQKGKEPALDKDTTMDVVKKDRITLFASC